MFVYFNKIVKKFALVINSAPMSDVEKLRLQHFSVFLILGVPTMLAYGVYNLFLEQYVLFWFIFLSALSLSGGWFALIKFNTGRMVYRVNTAIFSCLILYMLLIGGEGGSKILWMYIFPLISFFLFGKKEGLLWNILVLFASFILLWNPFKIAIAYNYDKGFLVRFVTTFLIVSVVAYWFEYLRSYYRDDLEQKNIQLQREIEDRKKAEERLKESEEKIRSWLEYSPVCTKILDCDCSLRYMSSAGVKHLKIDDITKFYGEEFPLDCYPEPDRTVIQETLWHIQETGDVITLETPVLDTKGVRLWFLSTFVPIYDPAGQCDYLMVVSADITDRKKAEAEQQILEKQLQQSQKMEAIGTLAGGIAHDFNNILTAILGYAELLQMNISSDGQDIEDVHNIITASNRAADLVKQLLTYSRKTDLNVNYCAPHLIVIEALSMLKATLPTSISLEHSIDSQCGTVLINSTHLHQIVINLCTNAAQSMPDRKGVLRIQLDPCEVSKGELPPDQIVHAGTFVLLTVSDTGMGMDSETLNRIFDPYFTTKELGDGTGLGLAVVHGIVQRSMGFIKVESTVGQGTEIRIYLPTTETFEDDTLFSDKPAEVSCKGNNERLLLVDDDPVVLRFFDRTLSKNGYNTTCYTDSYKALEAFSAMPESFDLLITDQTMPGLTGVDLIGAVLKIKPAIPIILCTGHSQSFLLDSVVDVGVANYICKPVGMNTLLESVNGLLQNRKI